MLISLALPILLFSTTAIARPTSYPSECLVFDDCPPRSHCYPLNKLPSPYNDEADDVNSNVTGVEGKKLRCACNHFLSEKGEIPDVDADFAKECRESQSFRTFHTVCIIFVIAFQLFVVYRGLKIASYLKKAGALKFNAGGQTLFGATLAPFFGSFVSLAYLLVLVKEDRDEYTIFDALRPPAFACCAFFLIWGSATLSFMWLDILAKSKMNNDAKKWIPRIQKFHNGLIVVTGVVNFFGTGFGRNDLAGAFDVMAAMYERE